MSGQLFTASSVDLCNESAARLERLDGTLRAKWRSNVLMQVVIAAVVTVGSVVMAAFFLPGMLNRPGAKIDEVVVKSPITGLHLMAVVGFAGFGLVGVVWFVASLVTLLGPGPKAGKAPRETMDKFAMAVIQINKMFPNWVDAYVCLLDQCKQSFGGYEGFVAHWKSSRDDMGRRVREHFRPRGGISETRWVFGECRESPRPDGMLDCTVTLVVTGMTGLGSPSDPMKPVGSVSVTATIPAAQVGGRWYIASKDWAFALADSAPQTVETEHSG